MDKVINFELIKNPFNWAILFLMVATAYLGAGYVASAFND